MEDNEIKKKYYWAIIGAILFLISIALSVFAYFLVVTNRSIPELLSKTADSDVLTNKETASTSIENLTPRMIDGVLVPFGKEDMPPFAFMIDNHIDARPQAGLDKAQLIIEAEAEGGITRYMAVFATDEKIDKIGPIRSARPYFIDWAKELSAIYVHVGGSPDALAKMIKENTNHINEFYNGEYFWRGTDFSAPHNVFTSTDKMSEYLNKKDPTFKGFDSWVFKEDNSKENQGTSTNIKINFILPGYEVEWQYDSLNNSYKRMLGGKEHKSSDGALLTAKNIIIQYVKGEVLDEQKRQSFEHIGKGKAVVCLDGFCKQGTWKKSSAESRTKFSDIEGNEFEFNAGKIWIEVVKPNYLVSF